MSKTFSIEDARGIAEGSEILTNLIESNANCLECPDYYRYDVDHILFEDGRIKTTWVNYSCGSADYEATYTNIEDFFKRLEEKEKKTS